MTRKDVPAVHRLLLEYLSQFHLAPVMRPEEVEHWLLPQENIIDTYLVVVSTTVKMYTTIDTHNSTHCNTLTHLVNGIHLGDRYT